MLAHDAGNHVLLCFGINYAGRIAGVGEQNSFGFRSDVLFDFFFAGQVVTVFYAGRNSVDFSAELLAEGGVVSVEGFENHDFVAGVAQSHNCENQGLAAAVGNENIFNSIIHAFFCIIFLYSFQEEHFALGIAVGDYRCLEFTHTVHELCRSGNIRLADVQMINLFACSLGCVSIRGQLSDRRCCQALNTLRKYHEKNSLLLYFYLGQM